MSNNFGIGDWVVPIDGRAPPRRVTDIDVWSWHPRYRGPDSDVVFVALNEDEPSRGSDREIAFLRQFVRLHRWGTT
jgi:hypothetical protein